MVDGISPGFWFIDLRGEFVVLGVQGELLESVLIPTVVDLCLLVYAILPCTLGCSRKKRLLVIAAVHLPRRTRNRSGKVCV